MTVSAHSFANRQKVFHSNRRGRYIGDVVMEIPHTDIALIRLHDREVFTNELFESAHMLALPSRLEKLAHSDGFTPGTKVFMDTPFIGRAEATAGFNSTSHVTSDNPNEPEPWIDTRWGYMGQNSAKEYVPGARGTVMWIKTGRC